MGLNGSYNRLGKLPQKDKPMPTLLQAPKNSTSSAVRLCPKGRPCNVHHANPAKSRRKNLAAATIKPAKTPLETMVYQTALPQAAKHTKVTITLISLVKCRTAAIKPSIGRSITNSRISLREAMNV
jgi:hypothetical protein